MPSQFPGMDEVLRYLQEQQAAENAQIQKSKPVPNISGQAPPSRLQVGEPQFPKGPQMMGNQPAPQARGGIFGSGPVQPGMGNFNRAAPSGGGGMGALRALKGAGSVAGLASLTPVAYQIGKIGGDAYYDKTMENAYKEPNPYSRTLPQQTYIPEELIAMQAQPQQPQQAQAPVREQPLSVPGLGAPSTQQGEQGVDYMEQPYEQTAQQVEQVPAGMDVEAQPDYQQMLTQQVPPRVEEMPESRNTLRALGTNKTERPTRPEPKKKNFIQNVGDFFRYGGHDPEQDKYERALRQYSAENQLTEPEKLAGGVAEKDIFSARQANYGGEMAKYEGHGVSPSDKFMTDYYSTQEKEGRAAKTSAAKDAREHGYRMEEIGAGAAMQKLSPAQQQEKFLTDFMEKYPDAAAHLLEQRGIVTDPGFTESIRKGREKPDPLDKMAAAMQALTAMRSGSSPTSTKDIKEAAKKKVEVKNTSRLQQAEK